VKHQPLRNQQVRRNGKTSDCDERQSAHCSHQ
jgi:hypothetical protein